MKIYTQEHKQIKTDNDGVEEKDAIEVPYVQNSTAIDVTRVGPWNGIRAAITSVQEFDC